MFYYSIFDQKTRCFGQLSPFEHREKEAAMRWLADYLNSNDNSMYTRHAQDFDLYFIGEWVEETGEFQEEKDHICCLADLIRTKE